KAAPASPQTPAHPALFSHPIAPDVPAGGPGVATGCRPCAAAYARPACAGHRSPITAPGAAPGHPTSGASDINPVAARFLVQNLLQLSRQFIQVLRRAKSRHGRGPCAGDPGSPSRSFALAAGFGRGGGNGYGRLGTQRG